MKNEKLSEWAEWGGAVDQSVRLFMMTGARDRLFDAFPMSPMRFSPCGSSTLIG